MNYYLYQGNNVIRKFHTQDEGIAGAQKARYEWIQNGLRAPALKLCYNGFQSVTILELPASVSQANQQE